MRPCCFYGVLFSFVQLKGGASVPLVYPSLADAAVGDSRSFHCVIDSVTTSGRQTIDWIFTEERDNFLRSQHIYAFGRVIYEWRDRCNVTEETNGRLTLTIRPATDKDFGFFTCFDNRDDSKTTVELREIKDAASNSTLSTNIETTNRPTPGVTPEAGKLLGDKRSSYETTEEKLLVVERPTRSMSTVIAMFVMLVTICVSAMVALAFVCLCLRKRSSKASVDGECNEGFIHTQISQSPYLQNTMTDETLYQQIQASSFS